MKNKLYVLMVLLCFVLLGFCGCTENKIEPSPQIEGKTLVWSDEFDVDGMLNKEDWSYSTGNCNGWGNAELQYYTDKSENSWIKDGLFHIKVGKDGHRWTSARVKTQYNKDFQYGYFEIRAKLPTGVGTWPAIWMMPSFSKYGNWPSSGEMDIMEMVGFDQNVIHTTIHTSAYNHKKGTQKGFSKKIKKASKKFHVYALDWQPSYIQFYVDGNPYLRFENDGKGDSKTWPFDQKFYFILNVAIGGSWGAQEGVDEKACEGAEMLVDYVRVYQ